MQRHNVQLRLPFSSSTVQDFQCNFWLRDSESWYIWLEDASLVPRNALNRVAQ